jgi:hypothetical protein
VERLMADFVEKKKKLCSASDGESRTYFEIKRPNGPSRREGTGLLARKRQIGGKMSLGRSCGVVRTYFAYQEKEGMRRSSTPSMVRRVFMTI